MTVRCLTDEQQQQIVDTYDSTRITKAELARQYGVSARTIGRVVEEYYLERVLVELQRARNEELQLTGT